MFAMTLTWHTERENYLGTSTTQNRVFEVLDLFADRWLSLTGGH